MRSTALFGALVLLLSLAPAPARAAGLNNLKAGVTGLAEFLADPVMDVIYPPEAYEDVPLYPVTGRILGLVSGTVLGVYRAGMGAFDVVFTPLWIMPTMSPEARWPLFEDVEY